MGSRAARRAATFLVGALSPAIMLMKMGVWAKGLHMAKEVAIELTINGNTIQHFRAGYRAAPQSLNIIRCSPPAVSRAKSPKQITKTKTIFFISYTFHSHIDKRA